MYDQKGTTEVRLFLFGAPRVEQHGVLAAIDTRKAIALLAYLVITGHSSAAIRWPRCCGQSTTNRARAVRRTLSVLNKALGAAGLAADRESVQLDMDGAALWADVGQFQSLLATARADAGQARQRCAAAIEPLAAAAALYTGDFLAGFSLRDSPAFDDWQGFQAERLRRELATAFERLVECHTLQGAFEPAIGYARRWLALDPLHEPAHCHLMRLYAWFGQRAAAIHQYRECVRVLEHELGVPPLEETTQLYQAIRENLLPPPASAERQPTQHPAAEPSGAVLVASSAAASARLYSGSTLVGRAAEWAALVDAYAAISAGSSGRLVVIEGEAGIGKTRLADELLRHARAAGATTISARCYEGETNLAYGPFVAGLRAALRIPDRDRWLNSIPVRWLGEISRLLPELEGAFPNQAHAAPLDASGAQSRLFEALSQLLIALCGGPPLGVLFLDDVHWADAASLDLLAYLVRRLHQHRLCVLLAWRGDSVPSNHRARAIVAEASRASGATMLSLPRLSRLAVTELVRLLASHPRPEELGSQLYAETEGLPFFVVEYLAALAQGAPPEAAGLPSGVRDLLQARLAGVSETGLQLLATAAVIGRSFDYDTVREPAAGAKKKPWRGWSSCLRAG